MHSLQQPETQKPETRKPETRKPETRNLETRNPETRNLETLNLEMMKQQHPDPGLTPEENLRAENELAALNLELRYGAETFIDSDAPPEVIQQFLANVQAFEAGNSKPKVTVYERIGKPAYATPDLLEAATLPGELERLLDILLQHGFFVDRPEDLDDLVFYEFITTEIFAEEVPPVGIPGMTWIFDYQEFHPDLKVVIGEVAEAFLLQLLHLQRPFSGELLSETCYTEHEAITKADAMDIIAQFRDRHQRLIPLSFQVEELLEEKHGTYLTFLIRWEAHPKDGGEKVVHEGDGVVRVGLNDDQWLVQGVMMSGFEF